MKKLLKAIVPLLLLTSCASQAGITSMINSNTNRNGTTNSVSSEKPIPNLTNLEPFKLNNPNKPFNTNPQ